MIYLLLNFVKIVCVNYITIYLECDDKTIRHKKAQLYHHLKDGAKKIGNSALSMIINFLVTTLVNLLLFKKVE